MLKYLFGNLDFQKEINKMNKNTEAIYDAKQLGTASVIILGLQHMFAMFGSTVLVPLLTGLSVSTTLLFALIK